MKAAALSYTLFTSLQSKEKDFLGLDMYILNLNIIMQYIVHCIADTTTDSASWLLQNSAKSF